MNLSDNLLSTDRVFAKNVLRKSTLLSLKYANSLPIMIWCVCGKSKQNTAGGAFKIKGGSGEVQYKANKKDRRKKKS